METKSEIGIFLQNYFDIGIADRPAFIFHPPNIEKARVELEALLQNFRLKHNLRAIVGIFGGAEEMGTFQRQLVNEFIFGMGDFKIGILSGGTVGGLPQIAVEEAHRNGLPTIGVFPYDREKNALIDWLDLAIKTPVPLAGDADFGTETPTLTRIPDAAIIISGGMGTLAEVSTILKRNKILLKKGEPPVYLIPIHGSGGVADFIYTLPGIEDVKSTLPPTIINSGLQAATFLKTKFA